MNTVNGQVTDEAAVEEACEVMHDAYERAAVVHGWDTNPAAKHKPWADVPESNKATMRDAVRALLQWQAAALPLLAPLPDLYQVRADIERAVQEAVDDLQITGIVESGPGPDHSTLGTLVGHVTGFALAAVKPYLMAQPTASLERVAEVLGKAYDDLPRTGPKQRTPRRLINFQAAALLAAGVFTEARPEAEVKAEAWAEAEAAIDAKEIWFREMHQPHTADGCSNAAMVVRALRAGGQS